MNKSLLILLILILSISSVSAQVEVTKSNDNLYLTLIAVALTILFTWRGVMKILVSNPAMILLLGFALIIAYILFSAVMIAFGIGDWIDHSIQDTVNIITNMRGN